MRRVKPAIELGGQRFGDALDPKPRMPAEWEPHAATWLAWPHQATDWPGKFGAIPWVFAELARLLQEGERICMIVRHSADQARARAALQSSGVDVRGRVRFWKRRTNRSWARDFMPLFVTQGSGPGSSLASVKFRFNGWARYPNHKLDEAAGLSIAQELGFDCHQPEKGAGRQRSRVVLEGGAIDVDGEGTLLATEECLLKGAQARNPDLGRQATEAVLHSTLGIRRVLWLGSGIAGDDTGGHVDDFARFVAPAKVVVAEEKNPKDLNYRPLAEAHERLSGALDALGRRVEVIALPMPEPVIFRGQRLPASYANFYIGTSVVLVPTFNDLRDRLALGILAELFPDRRVVGVYARDLVLGLGTIHCSTQQQPLSFDSDGNRIADLESSV